MNITKILTNPFSGLTLFAVATPIATRDALHCAAAGQWMAAAGLLCLIVTTYRLGVRALNAAGWNLGLALGFLSMCAAFLSGMSVWSPVLSLLLLGAAMIFFVFAVLSVRVWWHGFKAGRLG